MSVKENIRNNLHDLMVAKDVKNVELAHAIGVSKVAVTNWLNGSNSISIEKVPAICSFFNVSIDAFLSQSSVLDTGEKRLVSLYRMADEEGKTAILNAARHALANCGLRKPSASDQGKDCQES